MADDWHCAQLRCFHCSCLTLRPAVCAVRACRSILECCDTEGGSSYTMGWSVTPSPEARLQGLNKLKNPHTSYKVKTPKSLKKKKEEKEAKKEEKEAKKEEKESKKEEKESKKEEKEAKKKGKKEPLPSEEPYDEGQFEDSSSGKDSDVAYHSGRAGRCSITIHYFDQKAATHVGTDGLCLGVAIAHW